jgi:P pilus assembly chaperone PapD
MEHSQPPRQRCHRTRLHGSLVNVVVILISIIPLAGQAALNITPPQLAPDDQGVIATEVRSSLSTPSRWSVRIVPWDPLAPETSPSAAMPVSALPLPSHPLGVEVSPRFFSLAGAGRQVIRARITDRSKHYRLLIEQIPDDTVRGQGVNFRFRFSLPIYKSSQDPLIPRGVVIQ